MTNQMEKSGPSLFFWARTMGFLGFVVGFFGPMILVPDANQGPMLGIFITGPLGFVLGILFFFLIKVFKIPDRRHRFLLKVICIAQVGVTLFFILPESSSKGVLVKVQVDKCKAANAAVEETIQYWDKKIANVTWASPRNGWKEEMKLSLSQDKGIVLEALVHQENKILEMQKPWNKGQIVGQGWRPLNQRQYYYINGPKENCEKYKAGSEWKFFIEKSVVKTPVEWPPQGVPEFIPYTIPEVVPQEFENF